MRLRLDTNIGNKTRSPLQKYASGHLPVSWQTCALTLGPRVRTPSRSRGPQAAGAVRRVRMGQVGFRVGSLPAAAASGLEPQVAPPKSRTMSLRVSASPSAKGPPAVAGGGGASGAGLRGTGAASGSRARLGVPLLGISDSSRSEPEPGSPPACGP